MADRRHSLLLHYTIRAATIMVAALVVLTVVVGIGQFIHHRSLSTQADVTQHRAQFYRIIAGQAPADASVAGVLAGELHQRLGPINSEALPPAITEFHGNTNLYAGITEDIGLDPFAEGGDLCLHCGPLTAQFQARLERIKRGGLDQLISQEHVATTTTYTLTLGGVSVIVEIIIVWLVGGEIALGLGHLWAKSKTGYVRHFRDLRWNLDGTADVTKIATIAISPTFFAAYGLLRRIDRRRFDQKVRAKFSSETQMLDELDRDLQRVVAVHGDDPRVKELQRGRDDVMNELQSLTRTGQDDGLDFTLNRLNQDIELLRGGLDARKEFLSQTKSLEK